MKPPPMPLFNYKKRERHALVSDPQKNSNSAGSDNIPQPCLSNQTPSVSSSTSTDSAHKLVVQTSTPWKDTRNHNNMTVNSSFNNGPERQSVNRLQATTKSSPSHYKVPTLINHKPGVNNRRTAPNMPPHESEDENTYGQSSFTKSGNSQRANINTPAKSLDSHRGRGRGGRNTNGNGGNYNNFATGSNINADRSNTYQRGTVAKGRGSQNSGNHSFASYSSSGNGTFPSESFGLSENARPNPKSVSSLTWNNDKGNEHANSYTKPNAVKLQSGDVKTQFGMTRQGNSVPKQGNTSYPSSLKFSDGRGDKATHQSTNQADVPFSIFDAEDVALQPSSKYQRVSLSITDTSLRIFTCPIRDMQSWSETGLYNGAVLFEVYGLVISGPADTNLGMGKEFYVRDQSATIRCVFYEIDRELPTIMKGQVHRLIGSMDNKTTGGGRCGYFKVVSLRKADKEERSFCQQATEVSLHEMDKLARVLEKEQ